MQDIGDWVRFPDTLHEGYAHVAEVMGELSEDFIIIANPIELCSLSF